MNKRDVYCSTVPWFSLFPVLCITLFLICSCSAPKAKTPPAHTDAIVVLAGSYQERIPAAATLFKSSRATIIILTNDGVRGGWSRKYQRNIYHIERSEELLVESGVPREQIVSLPFYGSGTIYDALTVERYAQSHGLGRLLLVTSNYHAHRALWTFRLVLRDRPLGISMYPVSSTGSVVKEAVQESVKFLYYRIRFELLGLLPDLGET